MPLSPIPSRVVEIAGTSATRWDGDPDLVAMLLLPSRTDLTRGYDRYGSALAELGVSVVIPTAAMKPDKHALATAERLLLALRSERSAPPVVLAGHGIGGRLAAEYLQSERPPPDLAVLIGPDLGKNLRAFVVRTRVESGGRDEFTAGRAWMELMRSQRPGDAVLHPQLGHDLPNELGWRDRVQELVGWIQRATRAQWPDALPPAPEEDRWSRMTRAEATAAHEAYLATEDERLARFRDQVARRGGPTLEVDREGMTQLGAWLLDTVDVGPREAERPPWAIDAPAGPMRRLSSESLWLIDGAASHVAASLRVLEPTLQWELCTSKIDAFYQRTVLEPIHLAPPVPATAIFNQLTNDEPDADWLARAWDAWVQTLELIRQDRPARAVDPLDQVAIEPYDGDRWNAQIWIPEGTEAALGTPAFDRLGDRIRQLTGIEDLAWEDREVILIRIAPGLDPDELRRRVVMVLRQDTESAADQPS